MSVENENNPGNPPTVNTPTPTLPPQAPPAPTEPPKLDPEIEKLKTEISELRKAKEELDERKKKEEDQTKTATELLNTREKELEQANRRILEMQSKQELLQKGIEPKKLDAFWKIIDGDPLKADEALKEYPIFKAGFTPPPNQHQGAPGGSPAPPPNDEYKPGTAWEKYPEPRRKY